MVVHVVSKIWGYATNLSSMLFSLYLKPLGEVVRRVGAAAADND